jgi:hypothetical protein
MQNSKTAYMQGIKITLFAKMIKVLIFLCYLAL